MEDVAGQEVVWNAKLVGWPCNGEVLREYAQLKLDDMVTDARDSLRGQEHLEPSPLGR